MHITLVRDAIYSKQKQNAHLIMQHGLDTNVKVEAIFILKLNFHHPFSPLSLQLVFALALLILVLGLLVLILSLLFLVLVLLILVLPLLFLVLQLLVLVLVLFLILPLLILVLPQLVVLLVVAVDNATASYSRISRQSPRLQVLLLL